MTARPPPALRCGRCGTVIDARARHFLLRDGQAVCAGCVARYRLHRQVAHVADTRAAAATMLGLWP